MAWPSPQITPPCTWFSKLTGSTTLPTSTATQTLSILICADCDEALKINALVMSPGLLWPNRPLYAGLRYSFLPTKNERKPWQVQ